MGVQLTAESMCELLASCAFRGSVFWEKSGFLFFGILIWTDLVEVAKTRFNILTSSASRHLGLIVTWLIVTVVTAYAQRYLHIAQESRHGALKIQNGRTETIDGQDFALCQDYLMWLISYVAPTPNIGQHGDVINGNLRVTGHLLGESTGHRWIPLTKSSGAGHWCFLWSVPEQTVEQTIETPVIWDATALIIMSLQWKIWDLDYKEGSILNSM